MISGGLLILLVMMSSADQEVKEDLTSTVGGEVTIPGPVKSLVYLLKQGVVAAVRDHVLSIDGEGFLGRVSWDRDTGQFTIRRLQTNDSGIYSVDVKGTVVSYKLSVYDAVLEPSVSVTSNSSEGCTLLCVVDKLSGGTLSWYKGEDLVNQSSTQPSLSLTVDRLGLQSSYRCVSANPAGNLTRSVNAKTSCTGEQLPGDVKTNWLKLVGIGISVIFGVTVIVSVIIFLVVKRKKTDRHLQETSVLPTHQLGRLAQQESGAALQAPAASFQLDEGDLQQVNDDLYDLSQFNSIAGSPASPAALEANEDLQEHTAPTPLGQGFSLQEEDDLYDLSPFPSIAGSPASRAAHEANEDLKDHTEEEAVQPHSTIYDLLQAHSIAGSPASPAELA